MKNLLIVIFLSVFNLFNGFAQTGKVYDNLTLKSEILKANQINGYKAKDPKKFFVWIKTSKDLPLKKSIIKTIAYAIKRALPKATHSDKKTVRNLIVSW